MNIGNWQIIWWWRWMLPFRWEYPRTGIHRIFKGWGAGPVEVRHFTMDKRVKDAG